MSVSRKPADRRGGEPLSVFRAAVAADLRLLAGLHDHEPTVELLTALRESPFQSRLGLRLGGAAAKAGLAALDAGLASFPSDLADPAVMDQVAAEFAGIYLHHGYRASPHESVWLDEDGLIRQGPMFEVRKWYRHYGLETADWGHRSEDHLVLELLFVAHLMQAESLPHSLADAARFLDAHPLRWIGAFADRLGEMRVLGYFAGLARLTAAYLDELRAHLLELTGVARPAFVPFQPKPAPGAGEPSRYLPGVSPSW